MERQENTPPKESTNNQIPYELDFESQKQDGFAALRLSSFKWEKLERETTEEEYLKDMKNKLLGKKRNIKLINTNSDHKKSGTNNTNDANFHQCRIEIGMVTDGRVPPDQPPIHRLKNIIGKCSKPFEKQLTKSDLEKSQNRLKFKQEYVRSALQPILKAGEDINVGIPVRVFNSEGKEYSMKFKCWKKAYVLNGEWKSFVDDHYPKNLESNIDWATAWMFRHRETDCLCFAIIKKVG